MNTKIAATLTIVLFTLSTLAIAVPPASAHFTLGHLTGTSPFRTNDFDPHVPGVIGYVFPGAGAAAWTGSPSGVTPSIGYQSPYPGGNPPGAPSSWYQLEGNAYAPFGAILTSTTDNPNMGDLIFAINFTAPAFQCDPITVTDAPTNGPAAVPTQAGECPEGFEAVPFHTDVVFRRWYIYIPPEFGTIVRSQVSSTITNDYNFLRVSTASWNDPFGPGWTVVQIRGEDQWNSAAGTYPQFDTPDTTSSSEIGDVGRGIRRGYIEFTAARNYGEWFYVRVNGVTAPEIAGRYFFKFIMRPTSDVGTQASGTSTLDYPASFDDCIGSSLTAANKCVPVQNWPALLVKGEIDPAIIDGIVRYAGTNTTLYGTALNVAGRVRAVGTAIDPYTGQSTGRPVEARGYFNSTAQGHYEIEGVAPGVYTVYAEAAGFPEQVIADNVKVLAGQSLHFDGLLNPGPVIHGQVFSKHNFGEEPWTREAPIRIELWDSNDYADPTHMVAYSPWNLTDAPPGKFDYTGYLGGSQMSYNYIAEVGPTPERVAFPWENGVDYYSNTDVNGVSCGTIEAGSAPGTFSDVCRVQNGVGPAQYWWVDPNGQFTNGGGSGSFIYQFGYKIGGAAVYGAPKDFDGHVPQALATWINGLTAGRYYVRAYVNGYVQTALDGRTFQDYFFDVAKDEWSGDISVPLDLLKTSFITKVVHFHDIPGSLIDNPVPTTRNVFVEVWDVSSDLASPVIRGWNMTAVETGATEVSLNITGFGLHGFTPEPNSLGVCFTGSDIVGNFYTGNGCVGIDGSTYVGPHRVSTFSWQGAPYEDYGLPAGTYEVRTYVEGYLQQTFERVTLALSNSPAQLSDHMWKGAHFNVTVFSTDWEQPRIERPWNYPNEEIYVWFTNSQGNVVDYDQYFAQATDYNGDLDLTTTQATDLRCATGASNLHAGWSPCSHYFDGSDIWMSSLINDLFMNSLALATMSGGGEPILPTAFETDTYSVTGYTYGYVQKKPFSLYAQKGNSTADIKVNLVQGANITLDMKFKLENVFTPTPANMSMRVRAFNEKGELVAEWLTSPENEFGGGIRNLPAHTSFPTNYLNGVSPAYALGSGDPRNLVLDYVPAGTTDVIVKLNGVEDALWDPAHSSITGGYNAADGSPAPLDGSDFPYGIDGYPNYQGTWTLEADTGFWYSPNTCSYPDGPFTSACLGTYPPVFGLLQGESFHTIPGHPNGLYGYVGDALAANHLGPYAQRAVWTVPNAHLGGESSVTFELDQRAFISGQINAFTWSGELRPTSFTTIAIAGAGNFSEHEYTWDSIYEAFLNPGDYNFTIYAWSPAGQGYKVLSVPVHMSDGQIATGQNFGPLERSNIPVPEFTGVAAVAFSALAASLYVLRRRRR